MKVFHTTNHHTMVCIVTAGVLTCISSSEARRIGERNTKELPISSSVGSNFHRKLKQDWEQIGGNVDAGTTNYKESSFQVDISGDGSTVATGSPLVNNHQGVVRVSRVNPSTQTWEIMGSEIAGDEDYGAAGHSVSLSYDGTILAVGFPAFNELAPYICCGNSTARVYKWNSTASDWDKLGSNIFDVMNISVVDGIEYPDHFRSNQAGWDVSLSDDGMVVAVGAPSYFVSNTAHFGQVRVYQYSEVENDWKQVGQSISGDGLSDRQIGYSVSLSGDGTTLGLGDPHAEIKAGNGDNITRTQNGNFKVFKFHPDDSVWKLYGNAIVGGQEWGLTGESVSMTTNGSRIAVGHPGYQQTPGSGFYDSGLVRVYQIESDESTNSSSWSQIGSDIIPNFELEWEDGFGFGDGRSVSISGDGRTLAVAAPGLSINDVHGGLVRVFRFNDTMNDWNTIGKTLPGEKAYNANRPYNSHLVSLSSDGNRLVVGAPIHKVCVELIDWSCTYSPSRYSNWTGHVRVFDFTEVSATPVPTTSSPTYGPTTNNPTTVPPTTAPVTEEPTTGAPTTPKPTTSGITSAPTLEPTGHSSSPTNPSTEDPTLSETTISPTTLPPTGGGSGDATITEKIGTKLWFLLLLLNPLLLFYFS